MIARAGHRYTAMKQQMVEERPPAKLATAQVGEAQAQPLNPEGVLVAGDGLSAWTVDPALPMKVGAIAVTPVVASPSTIRSHSSSEAAAKSAP